MPTKLKKLLLHEHVLVFFFCLSVIIGPGIAILFPFDLTQFPDCIDYLGLGQLDFHQNPIRRYRLIVPLAAYGLNWITGGMFRVLSPSYFVGDFSLPFSFFVVNAIIMAFLGLLIYRYCRVYGASAIAAIVGAIAMLTCRYTGYLTALPLVDSLFCVAVAMVLLAIKEKNMRMLIAAIYLGPFAKESFLFIIPVVLCFENARRWKIILHILLSGVIVFSYRYIYDILLPPDINSLQVDLAHFDKISYSASLLFSFYGFYKILMTIGLWIVIPIAACVISKSYRMRWRKTWSTYIILFFLSVLLQMLLSGSLERMFFIAMPVLCMWVALGAEELKKQYLPAEK